MADEDVESIGGISVSIGASHAQLVSDLAKADQLLQAWAKRTITVQLGATLNTQGGAGAGRGGGGRQQAEAITFGSAARGGAQGREWENLQRKIDEATGAVREHKAVIVETQQVASQPMTVNLGAEETANDLKEILSLLRQVAVAAKEVGAIPPPKAAGRVPRAAKAKTTAATAGDGEEGEEETKFPRIQYIDQIERQRRQAREAAGTGTLEVNRSEQALNRQRQREEAAAATAQARGAATNDRTAAQQAKAADAARLQALTAQAEQAARFADDQSSSFAPPLSQAGRAALFGRRTAPRGSNYQFTAGTTGTQAPLDEIERERQRVLAGLDSRARRGRVAGLTPEDIERREEQRVAARESAAVAAGRTARTTASGFGGQFLFGGVARQQAEAVAAQAAAEQKLILARRNLNDPQVIRSARAYRTATQEVTVAEGELAKATERVQKLSGPLTAAKSLAAVTVAGAAFGLGLKAIDVALDLTGRALTPLIDRMTGFGTVTGRVVDQLSDQTRQAQGNAEAVVALSAAQAGLSKSAASVVQPLVTQQAQIEASNKSMGEAVDLFQTYTKLRQQGVGGITTQTGGFLGTGFFGTRSTGQELGRLFQGLPATAGGRTGGIAGGRGFGPPPTTTAEAATNLKIFTEGLKFANDQLVKGGDSVHKFTTALSADELQRSLEAFTAAGAPDELLSALRSQKIGVAGLGGVGDADTANRILQALNTGFAQQDPQLLIEQFNRQIPAMIAAAGRQLAYANQVQRPAAFGLGALVQPDLPVGTGFAPGDRAKITAGLNEANDLQDQLNAKYRQGQQIIQDTYRPAIVRDFGAAAAQSFDTALSLVTQTGQRIAEIQADISNEQAAYQVAQYNYQLTIAKRTLSDIAGLNDKDYGVGQSKLGILERQNLQLSRQGQQLQFALSQRQINFQTAVAGFSAPGVTPEERQANIAEAKLEASYAQKQLDIQRQMFGNQVQIVDISNLRQGRDLALQIFGPGGLVAGRQVTLDIQIKQDNITRLQKIQSQAAAEVNSYIGQVDNLASTAISQMASIEAAAGHAMYGVAESVLGQFGIFIQGINDYLGALGTGSSGYRQPTGTKQGGQLEFASGGVMNVGTPTRIGQNGLMGEAADETLIILSRPRTGTSGAGGGSTLVINFNGPVNANNRNDLDYITRSVMQALGKQGSLVGLRSGG